MININRLENVYGIVDLIEANNFYKNSVIYSPNGTAESSIADALKNIGDGIRPSERRKGYATAMIGLALKECQKLDIHCVLMTCDKDNIGSAKSIINNGVVLENEVTAHDGVLVQRYWIDLD